MQALPNTVTYRLRRFVRRHRIGVATAAEFVLLLAASVVALARQQAATVRERDRARAAAEDATREAARARQVTGFLVGLFEGSDPSVAQGDTLMARDILDCGIARIEALSEQPDIQATLLATTGRIHLNLGDVEVADGLVRRALTVWGTIAEPDERAVADARLGLAEALELRTRHEESADIYRAVAASHAGRTLPDVGSRALFGLFTASHALGHGSAADSALAAWESAVEASAPSPDPYTLRGMVRLGQTLNYGGEVQRARTLLRQAVEQSRLLYGAHHPDVLNAVLAYVGVVQGRPPTAEEDSVTADAVAIARRLYPEGHPRFSLALDLRATFLRARGDRGDLAKAEGLLRESLAMETEAAGRDGLVHATRNRGLALVLAERGHLEEAESRLREIVVWWRRNFGPDYPFTLSVHTDLGDVLSRSGQYDEAATLLGSTVERLAETRGDDDPYTQRALRSLAALYDAWGRDDEAAAYRSRLRGP